MREGAIFAHLLYKYTYSNYKRIISGLRLRSCEDAAPAAAQKRPPHDALFPSRAADSEPCGRGLSCSLPRR